MIEPRAELEPKSEQDQDKAKAKAKTNELLEELKDLSYHDTTVARIIDLYATSHEEKFIDMLLKAVIVLAHEKKVAIQRLLDLYKATGPTKKIIITQENYDKNLKDLLK